MLTVECENCEREFPAEDLEVHEEVDHEVWKVFTCPHCETEQSRVESARIKQRDEPYRRP